ncbi:trigger factor [Nosocomiicoccus ampullae]|uniref:Trigger factor n=1 Tax=Nosocomiicoccus ampullae TaxID=489910 RepID=A0A9Q2HFA5_9STAP|nr:trigger factor [Nosocomiicoccus ampullae]MBB5175332.1 trigger factor [Nosocomiicoccus ampullae]QYA46297.1 trigger factor [Nosocomiicoccus ampullae]
MSQTQTWEKKEGNVGTLTITVPAEEFDSALDQAFNKVKKDIQVPGFRKGKIPRQMFDKRFGVEALYQDALDIILPTAYGKAVEETGIKPVDQPQVDVKEIEQGKDLVLTAEVTVEPEVELGEYKGLEGKEIDAEVTEEDVNEQIEALLAQYTELVVKDGEVAEGDVANIDFKGFVDGEAFEGGEAEGHDLEIGSGTFIPGFEEQLVGLKAGDEKDVKVTFPEEYQAEELQGKEATFEVKVNEVKEKETPEFNDDFVKEELEGFDDAETAEDVKAKVTEDLKAYKEQEKDFELRESLVVQASENAKMEIPEAMVESEQQRMLQEYEQRLAQQGLNLELFEQISGQTKEDLLEQMKDDAFKRVRTGLTLQAISDAENIEASEEDIDNELQKLAEQFQMAKEDIKNVLGDLTVIENDIRNQKAIEFLVDNRKQ